MTTGTQTTSIFLAKGTEDEELRKELRKAFVALGFNKGVFEFAEQYPRLFELKQALDGERDVD